MPQVPVYGTPQVQEQALPNVRMGAQTSIEDFGGGKSLTAVDEATQGLDKTAFDIASQEKQKADQLAFMSADGQLSAAQTQIQVGTSKMLGKDALGAPDYAQKQWNDTVQNVQKGLNNDAQRMMFARSAQSRWDELNKSTQVHVSQQMQQFDDNETSSYLETSRNAAVLNADDPDKVNFELSRQKAAITDWAQRKGIPLNSPIFQARLADQLSGTNRAIIQTKLDKDDPDNVENARDYLEAHRTEFNAQDLVAAQKQINNAETTSLGLDAWDDVKNMKLSNGMPDENKMESSIMSRDDLSDERKLEIVKFVKARAKEEVVQKNMQDMATDRSFMNTAIKARQQGTSLVDALKIADRYSSDAYDQSVKEDAVRRMYAPPDKSDPSTYMKLWEGIKDGTIDKTDIDQASTTGKINTSDWKTLREQYYNSNTASENAESSLAWERIKGMAEENISDKKMRDQFMYVMHTIDNGENKSPDELIKVAKDKLENNAPGSGWFGSDWFGQKQYKVDAQKIDAQNLAWGKLYQDVGDSETKAIGRGVLAKGKDSWSLGDVDSFANQFGGYDKIKGGTPVNNAIQTLMKYGELVTPENVKTVLKKYPDGKH